MPGYHQDPDATRDFDFPTAGSTPATWVWCTRRRYRAAGPEQDLIISRGENIASVKVEQAIESHPAVLESAVVAGPHGKWGDISISYVILQPGGHTSAEDIINHGRSRLAHLKAPKRVELGDLPKTSTDKIQKVACASEPDQADRRSPPEDDVGVRAKTPELG